MRRVVAAALLLLAAAGKPDDVAMTQEQQRTIGLQTAVADRRPITDRLRASGVVGFDQGHVAAIHPLSAGRIRRLFAAPGDRVQAGQTLAELDYPALVGQQADLASAEAQLREAQAGIDVARAALHRADILTADGSMARAELDQRRLASAQAVAVAEAARFRAAALRMDVSRLNPGRVPGTARIVSPIAGVVVSMEGTAGELLETGAQVFLVADLSVVLVTAQIPEASAASVSVGDSAGLSQPGGKRDWQGRIIALGAALDRQSRTLPARILLANADGALRAGMFLDVTLTTRAGRDGVVVPAAAVQVIGERHLVFVPSADGHFTARDIQPGVQLQDWVEVRRGLAAGDRVVTKGSFELKSTLQQGLLGGAG